MKVPILYRTNTDEGTAISPSPIDSDEDFRAAVAQGGPDNETIAMIEHLYPNVPDIGIPSGYSLTKTDKKTYGTQWKRSASFFGDAVEHYPRRKVVSAYLQQNITAYSYRFNIQLTGLLDVIRVTHYQEVAWVWDNIDGAEYATNPFNGSLIDREAYVKVASLMSRMWASFVTDLDPNNHGLEGYPVWPRYEVGEGGVGENMVFNAYETGPEMDDWRVPEMLFLAEKAREQWKH